MENMKVLKCYNLVNDKGNALQLELGIGNQSSDEYPKESSDKGYRWRFWGYIIPMPVRSGYWFNGFTESVMLEWLKGNGWYPRTCVNMRTGRALVYELPSAEPIKGNEEHRSWDVDAFHNVIRELVKSGRRLTAVRVYRYAHHDATLKNSDAAVREICGES